MNAAPQVSVVLPAYNRAAVLARCMRTVLNQTYRNLELIVVDDASTDSTAEVVRGFPDARVRYVRRPCNGGAAAARNEGVRQARGELIAFQDSDDQWLVTKLERQVELLHRSGPGTGLVCGGYLVGHETGRPRYIGMTPEQRAGHFELDLLTAFRFITPTWLVRRTALDHAGLFDEGLPPREDWDLAFRLHDVCRFAAVDEPVLVKHLSADGIDADLAGRMRGLERALQRHAVRFSAHPELLARHFVDLGKLQAEFADPASARRSFAAAWRLAPSPGTAALWLATLPGRRGYLALRGLRRAGRPAGRRPALAAPPPAREHTLVSVILPTYNRAVLLRRAIASVLAQTHANLELIVVDDGSTEDVRSFAESFADARLRIIRRDRRGGAAAARNTGLDSAGGALIAFIDSDDEWLPDKLREQVARLQTAPAEVGLAVCRLLKWDGTRAYSIPECWDGGTSFRETILQRNVALTSGWCVRREAFAAVGGFDERLPPLEDWDWLLRYSLGRGVAAADTIGVVMSETTDSISRDGRRYIDALERLIAKHGRSLSSETIGLANLHYVLGKKYVVFADAAQGRRHFRRAIALRPGDWRPWAAIALSWVGAARFARLAGPVRS